MLSHDTKETDHLHTKLFFFLLCTPFVMLFDTLSLLPFLCYYDEAPSAVTSDFLSWI